MNETTDIKHPLQGIRVLDIGTFIAGPYCATLLAEFGAEVIKVEPPGGDGLRRFGTMTDCGDTLVWLNESRNKKCVTLDLRSSAGIDVLKRLIAKSDIIVENFRPGVMEKWGLDYEAIRAINPRAILVRISAYGQQGPYKSRPGFARVAHAFAGLSFLAGEPGRVPVTPGSTSLADYGSGLYAAFGALLALRAREATGQGQVVDLALYESLFRMLDEMVPAYQQTGFVRERMGADTVNVAPHSHYPTRDGHWIAIACTTDAMFARLAGVMQRPELALPEALGTVAARVRRLAEVNGIVADWTGRHDCAQLLQLCDAGQVPAAKLLSVADMFTDPQYAARGSIQEVDSRIGPVAVPAVIPQLSATPGAIRWLGQEPGSHHGEILRELLGMSEQEIAALATPQC
ncbi:MAG: CoA transferase [Delftia acidovorans]|jgi:crotonobetainyl-CoA:carnitine CoA-transferase CaiB-like acyl-CoA transferase|nr:CoA transferase [Delftia acidovorans]